MGIYNKKDQTERRQKLRGDMPQPELLLWNRLRAKQLRGYKFRRQYGIGNYVVDFYCSSLRLVIEVDGDSHYERQAVLYDQERQMSIESLGITVLRFTNQEVMENIGGVLEKLEVAIKKLETPSNSPSK